jgi:hypothetical protein
MVNGINSLFPNAFICAASTLQLAQAAHPEGKAEYRRLAAEWHQIAAEMEQFGTAKSAFPIEIGGHP